MPSWLSPVQGVSKPETIGDRREGEHIREITYSLLVTTGNLYRLVRDVVFVMVFM